MPKARDYHLSEEELVVIEAAIHHDKRPEERQRCIAIRLLHQGHKPEEVADAKHAFGNASSQQADHIWLD
jgi:hypothetical protein